MTEKEFQLKVFLAYRSRCKRIGVPHLEFKEFLKNELARLKKTYLTMDKKAERRDKRQRKLRK